MFTIKDETKDKKYIKAIGSALLLINNVLERSDDPILIKNAEDLQKII